jgi:catechol 2,3-dioxygenase-like lactoylglutathione lyase family enzyme
MMCAMRLAQALLFVHDVPRMTEFYRDALGLEPQETSPGFVRLAAGGTMLALHALRGEPGPGSERLDSHIKLCFHADDVEAARAALVARGVKMRDVVRFGDVALCDGLDPEGNVFQITSRG